MTLDPDRELQRIHSIIISQIKRLETLISTSSRCDIININFVVLIIMMIFFKGGCYYYNHDSNAATQFKVEDVNSYLHTLNELKNISLNLEQEHRIYQRQLARETKYGSK